MEGAFQTGFGALSWGNIIMLVIGLAFIWLAIAKKWECRHDTGQPTRHRASVGA
jgi:Na+-transporting methylmalonyl-CoA/oxaloacetate decarboxylase beta subunit